MTTVQQPGHRIELVHLSKQYGNVEAVRDLTVTLGHGLYGVLGPNGAGKSTLFHMLVRLLSPTTGQILLDGVSIERMGDAYFDVIGFLPQNPRFYPNFTVMQMLRYLSAVKGIPAGKIKDRATAVLKMVLLDQVQDRKIRRLSGGMRQRLGIAQALLNDPRILVLDEPSAGLDPRERIRLRNLLSELSATRTVLVATHIVPDLEYIADQVLILKEGRMLGMEPTEGWTARFDRSLWELEVPFDAIPRYLDCFPVGRVRYRGDTGVLRVIGWDPERNADLPLCAAERAVPGLEDVYLRHFGTGEET